MRALQAGQGVGDADRSAHPEPRRDLRRFLRPAGGDDVGAWRRWRCGPGAPVVPLFALPLGGGRYRMIYEHPVEPPRADAPDAVREFTQRCTDVLEMYVRRHPELWLWMHRRWRDDDRTSAESSRTDDRRPSSTLE